MNKELIQEWVKALRPGTYEQGTGQLVYGRQFCCLGVLGAIKCGSQEPDEIAKVTGSYITLHQGTPLGKETCMDKEAPWDIRAYPYKPTVPLGYACWQLNDVQRKTFPEIADYIEKVLLSDN